VVNLQVRVKVVGMAKDRVKVVDKAKVVEDKDVDKAKAVVAKAAAVVTIKIKILEITNQKDKDLKIA
jgi:hypothetical protein